MSTKPKKTNIPEIVVTEKDGANRIKLTVPPEFLHVRVGTQTLAIEDIMGDLVAGKFAMQEQVRALRRLKEANTRIKQLETLVDKGLDFEEIRGEIFSLMDMPSELPEWLDETNAPKFGSGSSKGKRVPVFFLSDLHYGERVDRNQMGGSNEFNLEIADQRFVHTVEKAIDICKNHTDDPNYPGVVVCFGGDMISGDIHEELKETNALPTLLTVSRLTDRLTWALTRMAEEFGQVLVPCVVGNHGRMGRKPQAKDYNEVNFETLLYLNAEQRLKQDKRIQFLFPNNTVVHFKLHGHHYGLTHGNFIGSRGGNGYIGSLGPMILGTMRTIASEASMGRPIDTLMMGHWHQYTTLPSRGLIANGTMKGPDEFSVNFLRAPYEPASQALFLHGPRGALQHHRVLCDPETQTNSNDNDNDRSWAEYNQEDTKHWEQKISAGGYWMDKKDEPSNDNWPTPANDNRDMPAAAPQRPQRRVGDDTPEPAPPTMGGGKNGGAKRKRRS